MNLQQLRSIRQVVKDGLSLTRAAHSLHASQPGVTRHIQQLEEELGVQLLVRQRRRAIALTKAGSALMPAITRALGAVEDLYRISEEFKDGAAGRLTVATVHTHARYVLSGAIGEFVKRFPAVPLRLRCGHRTEVASWVASGDADFSLGTLPDKPFPDLVFFPWYEARHAVFAPAGHPLLRKKGISLEDVAAYPIITYDSSFGSREDLDRVFAQARLALNIVLSAADVDIMKTYVSAGLGIGIFSLVAYDRRLDKGLRVIDAGHLFQPRTVHIGIRRDAYLGHHAMKLIELLAPKVLDKLRDTRRP